MLIRDLVMKDKSTLDRYVFYRGLGYSVEASELLSCVTYGDEDLAHVVSKLKGGDIFRGVRTWLEKGKPDPIRRSSYQSSSYQSSSYGQMDCLSYTSPISEMEETSISPPRPSPGDT